MSNRGYSGEVRQTRRKSSLQARRFLLGKLFHFSKYFRAKWKLKCELYRDFPLFYLRHFSPATICPSRRTYQNNTLLNLKHAKFCIYFFHFLAQLPPPPPPPPFIFSPRQVFHVICIISRRICINTSQT